MLDRDAELRAIRNELDGYQSGWARAVPTAEAIVELRDYLDFALPVGEALSRWGGEPEATAEEVCHWLTGRLHRATAEAASSPPADLDADFAVTAGIVVRTKPSGTWWILGVDLPGALPLDLAMLAQQYRTGAAMHSRDEG